jgi:uncharacterized repeat protein (TIGR01451 family)/CSLREA domain-containing protein
VAGITFQRAEARYLVPLSVLALLLAGVPLFGLPTQADATITVTTTSDAIASGDGCSLREAIIAANTDSELNDCPAGSGADTIVFGAELPLPATFLLTNTGTNEDGAVTGDLDIAGTLTIEGVGPDDTIVDGNGTDRVFEILPGARVTISGVQIRNGNPGSGAGGGGIAIGSTGRLMLSSSAVVSNTAATGAGIKVTGLLSASNSTISGNSGGGIYNDAGLLLLSNVDVISNTGGYGIGNLNGATIQYDGGLVSDNQGGGIYNNTSTAILSNLMIRDNTGGGGIHNQGFTRSQLTLSASAVMSNTATSGAGILNEGLGADATIADTRLSYNVATAGGGGVNNSGTMTIRRSTIDHNQARSGGGVDNLGFILAMTNDTLSDNSVTDNGGGLHNRATASLTNVTLHGNTASGADSGGNIFNDGDSAQLTLVNTIVANAGDGGNCVNSEGILNSLGHNLESTDTCGFGATGDITDADPFLGPLQDNGGATRTQALLPGSPAIDAGDSGACPGSDQRGVARPQGASCDIGSYELISDGQADLSVTKEDAVDPVVVGDAIVYTVTVGNGGPDPALNVSLTDDLPSGVAFTSATPDQGNCTEAGGTVACDLSEMASGASADVVIVVATTASGTLANSATVTSDMLDLNLDDNSASEITTVDAPPVPEANLSIGKSDGRDPVTTGAVLTYTLVVTNSGPDAATAVAASDTLPPEVAYGAASGMGWSCVQAEAEVTCTRPSLAIGVAPTIVITVAAPVSTGTLTNTVAVTSTTTDPNPADNYDVEQTSVQVHLFHYAYLPLVQRRSKLTMAGIRLPEPLRNLEQWSTGP